MCCRSHPTDLIVVGTTTTTTTTTRVTNHGRRRWSSLDTAGASARLLSAFGSLRPVLVAAVSAPLYSPTATLQRVIATQPDVTKLLAELAERAEIEKKKDLTSRVAMNLTMFAARKRTKIAMAKAAIAKASGSGGDSDAAGEHARKVAHEASEHVASINRRLSGVGVEEKSVGASSAGDGPKVGATPCELRWNGVQSWSRRKACAGIIEREGGRVHHYVPPP